MRPAPGRQRASRRVRRLPPTKPISTITSTVPEGVTTGGKQSRWAATLPTNLGSTTCTVMCRNGWRTAGTKITPARLLTVRPGRLATAASASCVTATLLYLCLAWGPPGAPGFRVSTACSIPGSVLPGRFEIRNSWTSHRSHLIHGLFLPGRPALRTGDRSNSIA